MPDIRKEYGYDSEDIAAEFIKKLGYRIIERNFCTKLGEIDIIADHNGTLTFVEVKARRTDTYGSPKESITYAKKKKLTKLALYYLKSTKQMNTKARFDVVIVDSCKNPQKPEVEIIENAFPSTYG